MAFRVIICAVGIYFMEDTVNFLRKCTCNLYEVCARHFTTNHKSLIVRRIGSHLKWIHAPRLHIVLREELEGLSTFDDNDSLKCNCLSSNIPTEEPKNSEQLQNRVEELEKELLRLQVQVSNILLKRETNDMKYCSDVEENIVSSPKSVVLPSIPPPPPPPPPPLPPTPLVQTRTLLVRVTPKSAKIVEKDTTSTIMEELSKRPPKLRHVERSPGGRPIRSSPVSSDPSDILGAVLRKRFEAIHGQKQECYMVSPENCTKTPMITGH